MPHYEYRVVPAPTKGQKAKGVRGHENRFAYALQDLMNRMGAEGWEYQRAETLPSEERHGLTSVTTTYRNVLVFRRPVAGTDDAFVTCLLDAPAAPPAPLPAPAASGQQDTPDGFFDRGTDNGVEDAEDLDSPAAALLKARASQMNATPSAPPSPENAEKSGTGPNTAN
ncbi:MAG: DUF4177 domain-containing protein [Thalassovita sp.]